MIPELMQDEFVGAEPRGGITLAKGFRAAGIHCGVKKTKKDIALIVSDVPAVAAAVFTLNRVQAAPVVLSKQHFSLGKPFRAIVVNSGNANACTGDRGFDDACAMADTAAEVLGVDDTEIFVASTGVIGEPLPIGKVTQGIRAAAASSPRTPRLTRIPFSHFSRRKLTRRSIE